MEALKFHLRQHVSALCVPGTAAPGTATFIISADPHSTPGWLCNGNINPFYRRETEAGQVPHSGHIASNISQGLSQPHQTPSPVLFLHHQLASQEATNLRTHPLHPSFLLVSSVTFSAQSTLVACERWHLRAQSRCPGKSRIRGNRGF